MSDPESITASDRPRSGPESIPVSNRLRSEPSSNRELSTKALHKYIFFVITMLGVLLQLKQGAGTKSLFDTDYPTIVILIVVLIVYSGSLIGGTYIRQAQLINSDLGKFMSKISLLFGALALVLELVILVPTLGVAALLFWISWFVSFVAVYSYPYVKTLFTKAVGAFEKLKEYLKNMIIDCCSEDPTGLPS